MLKVIIQEAKDQEKSLETVTYYIQGIPNKINIWLFGKSKGERR